MPTGKLSWRDIQALCRRGKQQSIGRFGFNRDRHKPPYSLTFSASRSLAAGCYAEA